MSKMRCHCCGGMPDEQALTPRYCMICRAECRLVERYRILRGPSCPFITKNADMLRAVTLRIAEAEAARPTTAQDPEVEAARPAPPRGGLAATGLPHEAEFSWRGRVRRNVPGG